MCINNVLVHIYQGIESEYVKYDYLKQLYKVKHKVYCVYGSNQSLLPDK